MITQEDDHMIDESTKDALWEKLMAKKNKSTTVPVIQTTSRKRIEEPLPPECAGNPRHTVMAKYQGMISLCDIKPYLSWEKGGPRERYYMEMKTNLINWERKHPNQTGVVVWDGEDYPMESSLKAYGSYAIISADSEELIGIPDYDK